jgi:hypothetical protein
MELDISAEQFYRLSGQLWLGGRRQAGNDLPARMYETAGTSMIFRIVSNDNSIIKSVAA